MDDIRLLDFGMGLIFGSFGTLVCVGFGAFLVWVF